jgi:hypothetical protein
VAVIVADPVATEVTSPVDDTVATDAADVAHVTVAPLISLSLASLTVGVRVAVSANDENVRLVGESVTDVATWATVTEAVALSEPDVAVIVAVPSATEVTRPADETVATDAADVAHVTVAPDIVAPFWSLTVADSWDVAPSEARLRLVTERVIDVATGVGVEVVEVGLPSPPQLHNNSENTTAPNSIVLFMP